MANTDYAQRRVADATGSEQLEALQRALAEKSDYLRNVSHELRTPLNTVVNYAEIALASEKRDVDHQEYLRTIHEASMAMLRIVNDFLDIEKMTAGHLHLEESDFELSDVTDSALSLIAASAEQKGLLLVPPNLSAVPRRLVGDPCRLRQVLVNLLGNAVKFTDNGTVELTVSVDAHGADGPVLRFSVIDTGIGIAPDALPNLFTPFFQAQSSTARCYGGSGLGLNISQRLVHQMGGAIEVDSVVGRGSRFAFAVALRTPDPRRVFRPVKLRLPAKAVGGRCDANEHAHRLRGKYILVVDDIESGQQIALEEAGLTVDLVDNGLDAINRVQQANYDAVLMDLHMPGIDGYETTRRIRALPAGHHVPIIAVTGGVSRIERERCLAAGMDDHVSKPVRLPQLCERLADILDAEPDFDDCRRELGWTEKMLTNQLQFFADRSAETLAQLRAGHASEDRKTVARLAHNLKGTATAFRATRLARVADALESCQDAERSGALIDDICRILPSVTRAVESKLNSLR